MWRVGFGSLLAICFYPAAVFPDSCDDRFRLLEQSRADDAFQTSVLLEEIIAGIPASVGTPEKRAKLLYEAVDRAGLEASSVIPVRNGKPFYKKTGFSKDLVALAIPELDQIRVQSKQLPDQDTTHILFFLHGVGADYSNMGSVFFAMQTMQDLNTFEESRTNFARNLRREMLMKPEPFKPFVVAIDLPMHGVGPRDASAFSSVDGLMTYLAESIRDIRAFVSSHTGRDLPVVGIGRSASPPMLLHGATTSPGLLDGLITISPTHPEFDLTDQVIEGFIKEMKDSESIINYRGIKWYMTINNQLVAHRRDDPFGNTPTLVMTGGQDVQVSEESRRWLRDQAAALPHVSYVNYPDMRHDLLRRPPNRPADEAHLASEDFNNLLPIYRDVVYFLLSIRKDP